MHRARSKGGLGRRYKSDPMSLVVIIMSYVLHPYHVRVVRMDIGILLTPKRVLPNGCQLQHSKYFGHNVRSTLSESRDRNLRAVALLIPVHHDLCVLVLRVARRSSHHGKDDDFSQFARDSWE